MAELAEVNEWQGGKFPGSIYPYIYKGRQVGWCFQMKGAAAENVPREERCKAFPFLKFGGAEGAKLAAEAYQRRLAEDYGLEVKNQYRFRTDPNDGLPYIEFHIRDTTGEDHYPTCDVGDLPSLGDHTWHIFKDGNNIYVGTKIRIDGKQTTKLFHSFKRPDWPMVDHHSEIPEENRNGLDNRDKHLRVGSGGVNEGNCRLQKNNTSGVNGVDYCKSMEAWRVRIQTMGVRPPPRYFPGPEDKTHPSYLEARACQRELAAKVGNTNG